MQLCGNGLSAQQAHNVAPPRTRSHAGAVPACRKKRSVSSCALQPSRSPVPKTAGVSCTETRNNPQSELIYKAKYSTLSCRAQHGPSTFWLHTMMFLHIHRRLHEYIYVRMLGCMSTLLYVHATHTQHTHTRTNDTHHTIMNFPHDCSPTQSLSKLRRNI